MSHERIQGAVKWGRWVKELLFQKTSFNLSQTNTKCMVIFSARKVDKVVDPFQHMQMATQYAQNRKEKPMYCKAQVYAGIEEFSLEELRAAHWFKKKKEEEMKGMTAGGE